MISMIFMKKIIILFSLVLILLSSCSNPENATTILDSVSNGDIALVPPTDNGNGLIDKPSSGNEINNALPIEGNNTPPPSSAIDPNDPWQNLQIGDKTKGNVGVIFGKRSVIKDFTGFNFDNSYRQKITIYDYYYPEVLNSYISYEGKFTNLGEGSINENIIYSSLESHNNLLGLGLLYDNFAKNVYKQELFYNDANPAPFNPNLEIARATILVQYVPDETKWFDYYFKGVNDGYGELELVGYSCVVNGVYTTDGDTELNRPYIPTN